MLPHTHLARKTGRMKVAKRLRRHLAAHRRTRPLQGRKTGRGERAPEDAASVETGSESPAGEGEPDQQQEGGAVIICSNSDPI